MKRPVADWRRCKSAGVNLSPSASHCAETENQSMPLPLTTRRGRNGARPGRGGERRRCRGIRPRAAGPARRRPGRRGSSHWHRRARGRVRGEPVQPAQPLHGAVQPGVVQDGWGREAGGGSGPSARHSLLFHARGFGRFRFWPGAAERTTSSASSKVKRGTAFCTSHNCAHAGRWPTGFAQLREKAAAQFVNGQGLLLRPGIEQVVRRRAAQANRTCFPPAPGKAARKRTSPRSSRASGRKRAPGDA